MEEILTKAELHLMFRHAQRGYWDEYYELFDRIQEALSEPEKTWLEKCLEESDGDSEARMLVWSLNFGLRGDDVWEQYGDFLEPYSEGWERH